MCLCNCEGPFTVLLVQWLLSWNTSTYKWTARCCRQNQEAVTQCAKHADWAERDSYTHCYSDFSKRGLFIGARCAFQDQTSGRNFRTPMSRVYSEQCSKKENDSVSCSLGWKYSEKCKKMFELSHRRSCGANFIAYRMFNEFKLACYQNWTAKAFRSISWQIQVFVVP